MLAVVWLSGEGLLAVAVPGEARVGKVMSWMPCERACCCFWRSFSSWAWAWAVNWLNRGYWESCCSKVNDSVGTAWGRTHVVSVKAKNAIYAEFTGGLFECDFSSSPFDRLLWQVVWLFHCYKKHKPNHILWTIADVNGHPNLTCVMLMGEDRVGESCCGDCWRWRSEVRVSGTTGGCRRCAVTVMVGWEEVGIPGVEKRNRVQIKGFFVSHSTRTN